MGNRLLWLTTVEQSIRHGILNANFSGQYCQRLFAGLWGKNSPEEASIDNREDNCIMGWNIHGNCFRKRQFDRHIFEDHFLIYGSLISTVNRLNCTLKRGCYALLHTWKHSYSGCDRTCLRMRYKGSMVSQHPKIVTSMTTRRTRIPSIQNIITFCEWKSNETF